MVFFPLQTISNIYGISCMWSKSQENKICLKFFQFLGDTYALNILKNI